MKNPAKALVGMLLLTTFVVAVACAGTTPTPTPAPTRTPVPAPTETPVPLLPEIRIEGAWVRPASIDAAVSMTPTPMPGMMAAPTAMAGMMMTPTAMAMGTPMPMPGVATTGVNSAAYMVIVNTGTADDALISAFSDVAASTELHESSMVDGVMRMTPVEKIPVPAGGRAELKQGGLHVMMVGLKHSLLPGDKVLIVLHFEKSGEITVAAEVRQP